MTDRDKLVEEFMKRVKCLALEVPAEVYQDFRPWADKAAQQLRQDGEEIAKLRAELEATRSMGNAYRLQSEEHCAERDRLKAELADIYKIRMEDEQEATIETLREELRDARVVIRDLIQAMRLWGSWEDGIPETGQDAHGSVGAAFDRACYFVDDEPQALQPTEDKPNCKGE